MRAVAVFPQRREVRLVEHPEPRIETPSSVKLRMLEVGVCGTDRDLCDFRFGAAPPGCDYFVLGHESLGEVVEAGPEAAHFRPGDLAVGMVRLPCAVPGCAACRAGRQDFCMTGRYRERGIQDYHGFMTDLVVEEARYLYAVPPELREIAVLVEPLTVAEKPLAELRAIERRLPWERATRRAVVLGAGPVGLLGAMALIEEGFQTWVYSRSRPPNVKAWIAEAIGAEYVSSAIVTPERLAERVGGIDVVYEAAGVPLAAFDLWRHLGPNGVFIFTGVPGSDVQVDWTPLGLNLLMKNQLILGTVNAGPDAFKAAIRHLGIFLRRWPGAVRSLISARWPLERFREPVAGAAGGIKHVIEI
ncbi:MAG: glucose 1-dehydrogenase [Bryobacteraceae bacterium]